ncbi:MAG: glycosyltransferase [Geminicoccaceae bacterium]
MALLSVTRLFERKGLHHLLDAAAGLRRPVPIDIVGAGPQRAALEAQAARLGLPVTFHGWLDNDDQKLRDLLEKTAIFVLPSSAENFRSRCSRRWPPAWRSSPPPIPAVPRWWATRRSWCRAATCRRSAPPSTG